MTSAASEAYAQRIAHWTARHAAIARRSAIVSRARIATFLGGVALLWWGDWFGHDGAELAGVAAFATFACLVALHARVLNAEAAAKAAVQWNKARVARVRRDWSALPATPPPQGIDIAAHPYAGDLDLFGHASIATWLGPAATPDGSRRLWQSLLAPAPPETIRERQHAVDDLAPRREWRESLGVEGQLLHASGEELKAFVEWAESSASVVPRAMRVIAPALTLAVWVLLVPFLHSVIAAYPLPAAGQDPNVLIDAWIEHWPAMWWLLPMAIGAFLSYTYERVVHRAFDRAVLGERSLPRYASMLALVCREQWTAPLLANGQAGLRRDGDAPAMINQLARRSQWSELRSVPLLHFPFQALTLWDFHVLHALERWRQWHGRRVRGWFDALGEIDAAAVLAAVRGDEPDWAVPEVTPSATMLEAGALGHPLIAPERRVSNDVAIGPQGTLLLVTGSNMSGKSTLLRAVGANVVLAQAGAPVCAVSLRMPPADLCTSVRIEDSLERGLSYFMASLARLKMIVDAADHRPDGRLLLYLLDELLQGTNSAERAIAVLAVVRHLLRTHAVGAMTTHDLALASEPPLSTAAELVHFSEQMHPDGSMTFDYRLRPGLATSTNALRLMQLIGIDPR
ncbi:MAG: MutS-related protein [Vicinamibacterales bacterium]